jgi:hypothetical protein
MKKLVVSTIVLLLAIASFFMLKEEAIAETFGDATIIIVNQSGTEIVHDEINFEKGTTLFSLLEKNYSVRCANDSYNLADDCSKTTFGGHVILHLDKVETDWFNSYIAMYINGIYSTKGIDLIPLNDGEVYKFVYTSLGGANDDD